MMNSGFSDSGHWWREATTTYSGNPVPFTIMGILCPFSPCTGSMDSDSTTCLYVILTRPVHTSGSRLNPAALQEPQWIQSGGGHSQVWRQHRVTGTNENKTVEFDGGNCPDRRFWSGYYHHSFYHSFLCQLDIHAGRCRPAGLPWQWGLSRASPYLVSRFFGNGGNRPSKYSPVSLYSTGLFIQYHCHAPGKDVTPDEKENSRKIVFTGGPGFGKSTVLELLSSKGYIGIPDVPRELIVDQQTIENGVLPQNDFTGFARLVLDRMKIRYLQFPDDFREAIREFSYSQPVFIFPAWKELYGVDNVRYETYEQARDIGELIRESYKSAGYRIIDVTPGTVTERIDFIKSILGWTITGFSYLPSTDAPGHILWPIQSRWKILIFFLTNNRLLIIIINNVDL